MKISVEVVRDFDNSYYVNMVKDGKLIKGLPEYVDYRTLKTAVRNQTGFEILPLKELTFKQYGRKQHASFKNYN